jgi:uncharacterized protein (DUF1684 family)
MLRQLALAHGGGGVGDALERSCRAAVVRERPEQASALAVDHQSDLHREIVPPAGDTGGNGAVEREAGGMDRWLELADWRERVARLHLAEPRQGEEGVAAFRRGRDELFAGHPQSPLAPGQRGAFKGLAWFPYSAGARVESRLEPVERGDDLEIDTGGEDGVVSYRRVGRLATPFGSLTLLWTLGYGGGLFLPFRDGTAGRQTYGAGRYLTDTIKCTYGRGLEVGGDTVTLDFNYAYNPSCAYDSGWACPLAPFENRVDAPIQAGELAFPGAI